MTVMGGVSVPETCPECGVVVYLPVRYVSPTCSGCGSKTVQITDRSPMDQHRVEVHG